MNNDDDNLIISFKKPSNRTNIDLREKLCLHAKEIFEFRQLTCCIDNEEELQLIVVALMLILHHMSTLPTMNSLGPRVQFPAMDAKKKIHKNNYNDMLQVRIGKLLLPCKECFSQHI